MAEEVRIDLMAVGVDNESLKVREVYLPIDAQRCWARLCLASTKGRAEYAKIDVRGLEDAARSFAQCIKVNRQMSATRVMDDGEGYATTPVAWLLGGPDASPNAPARLALTIARWVETAYLSEQAFIGPLALRPGQRQARKPRDRECDPEELTSLGRQLADILDHCTPKVVETDLVVARSGRVVKEQGMRSGLTFDAAPYALLGRLAGRPIRIDGNEYPLMLGPSLSDEGIVAMTRPGDFDIEAKGGRTPADTSFRMGITYKCLPSGEAVFFVNLVQSKFLTNDRWAGNKDEADLPHTTKKKTMVFWEDSLTEPWVMHGSGRYHKGLSSCGRTEGWVLDGQIAATASVMGLGRPPELSDLLRHPAEFARVPGSSCVYRVLADNRQYKEGNKQRGATAADRQAALGWFRDCMAASDQHYYAIRPAKGTQVSKVNPRRSLDQLSDGKLGMPEGSDLLDRLAGRSSDGTIGITIFHQEPEGFHASRVSEAAEWLASYLRHALPGVPVDTYATDLLEPLPASNDKPQQVRERRTQAVVQEIPAPQHGLSFAIAITQDPEVFASLGWDEQRERELRQTPVLDPTSAFRRGLARLGYQPPQFVIADKLVCAMDREPFDVKVCELEQMLREQPELASKPNKWRGDATKQAKEYFGIGSSDTRADAADVLEERASGMDGQPSSIDVSGSPAWSYVANTIFGMLGKTGLMLSLSRQVRAGSTPVVTLTTIGLDGISGCPKRIRVPFVIKWDYRDGWASAWCPEVSDDLLPMDEMLRRLASADFLARAQELGRGKQWDAISRMPAYGRLTQDALHRIALSCSSLPLLVLTSEGREHPVTNLFDESLGKLGLGGEAYRAHALGDTFALALSRPRGASQDSPVILSANEWKGAVRVRSEKHNVPDFANVLSDSEAQRGKVGSHKGVFRLEGREGIYYSLDGYSANTLRTDSNSAILGNSMGSSTDMFTHRRLVELAVVWAPHATSDADHYYLAQVLHELRGAQTILSATDALQVLPAPLSLAKDAQEMIAPSGLRK